MYGAAVAVYTFQAKKFRENVPIRIIPGPPGEGTTPHSSLMHGSGRIFRFRFECAQPWTDHVDRSGIKVNSIVAVGPLRSC